MIFIEKNTKRILAGIGAAAGVVTAAGLTIYRTATALVSLALDREISPGMARAKEKVSGNSDRSAFLQAVEQAAQKLRQVDCEEIHITAQDGISLTGHWRPCADAKRTIIAVHGWRSSWADDFALISNFWYENSCNVLYIEQRGQNSSGGDYMGFGMLERYDCLDWARWVNEQCGTGLPLYLVGVSMGAASVLMASGLSLPPNVCGIIADCGYTSAHEIWKHIVKNNLHLSYDLLHSTADTLCKKKIHVEADSYSTLDALRENTIPVLLIHGTDDRFVPVEMTYENYQACTAPKRLLIVPGADHAMSYYTEPRRYEAALRDFWTEFC